MQSIKETNLRENRRLIPIDVFAGQFLATKVDNHDESAFDSFASWGNSGQHPIHFQSVSKPENHFIYEPFDSDRTRDRHDFRIRWHLGDEVARIEFAQLNVPDASGQNGYVIHVSVSNHGVDRRFGVVRGEFPSKMLLPKIVQKLLAGS